MDGVAVAILGILGSATVALLTWLLSLVPELQKSVIHKEHTKFASFHAKQVEVLAEIYKQLSQNLTVINRMVTCLPSKRDKSSGGWAKYNTDTSDDLKTLKELYEHHLAYRRAHAVFLDDDLENILKGVSQNINSLIVVRMMNPKVWHSLKEDEELSLYREVIYSTATEINKLMPEIKIRVKQIISV